MISGGKLAATPLDARWASSMIVQPAQGVQWLSAEREAEWDAFVDRHPLGLVYHLSAWRKILKDAFPHISGRFLGLSEDTSGTIAAGLPVYRVRSWLLGNRIVSIPFASFCNTLVSNDSQLEKLLAVAVDEYQHNGSDRLEIRMTDSTGQMSHPPLSRVTRFKHNFLPLGNDPDELFAGLSKTSICQKVNKARKAGVVIEEADDEKSLRVCHSILVELRHRISLPAIPFAFFEAMRRHLWPEHLKVFLAMKGGKPIACHLVLTYKNLWISEYSANTNDALHGANQLLYWETIRRAIAAGAKSFSFGRTSSSNVGLLSYKRRWNTLEEDVAEHVLTRNGTTVGAAQEMLSPRAKQFFKVLLRNSPVTVNRMIGAYCYRHMG